MSGVGGGRPHYVNRNEWDEHAREHWRRMAAERMSPRDRQRAAIEELRTLEAKAVDMSAATTDSVKKAGFAATVAEIRAAIKRKESEMPQTDLEAPGRIRSAFNAKAGEIRAALEDLAADDGRQPDFKNRKRAELTADLDRARTTADAALSKWAGQAAREATKAANADTREPADVMKDMATEMRAQRLAASVTTQTEATNKLMGEAQRLRSIDFRQAQSYAIAAATHGAPGAARLAAEIERDYRSSWAGHAEAAELAATVEREVSAWRIESAAVTVQANRSAIAAAKRTGDNAGSDRLADETMRASIGAKNAAYAESRRTGTVYRSPIEPDPTPTRETTPIFDANPSTTIR